MEKYLKTKVSAIIPCFNNEKTLESCILSAIQQTYAFFEIIIIDNNSTDQTLQIAKNLQLKYELNIPLKIEKETSQGAAYARNLGLLLAEGEWIQFLDADDKLLPNKLKSQVMILHSSPKADVIFGNYICNFDWKVQTKHRYVDENILNGIISANSGIFSSSLFKRSTLINVQGLRHYLEPSEDYDLFKRLFFQNCQFLVDQQFNTVYYIKNESLSRSKTLSVQKNILLQKMDLRVRIKHELELQNLLTIDFKKKINDFLQIEWIIAKNSWAKNENQFLDQIKLKYQIIINPFDSIFYKIKIRFKKIIYSFKRKSS